MVSSAPDCALLPAELVLEELGEEESRSEAEPDAEVGEELCGDDDSDVLVAVTDEPEDSLREVPVSVESVEADERGDSEGASRREEELS